MVFLNIFFQKKIRKRADMVARPEPSHSHAMVLWLRIGRRLRTQVRVAAAFRTAAVIASLRHRTNLLATHALLGPEASQIPRRFSDQVFQEEEGLPAPTPALVMWRIVVAKLRYQIRVVHAFRENILHSDRSSMTETGSALQPPSSGSGKTSHGGSTTNIPTASGRLSPLATLEK